MILALALLAMAIQPSARPPARLYVTNQDDATISVIDMATKRVVETIDLKTLGFGATAGSAPPSGWRPAQGGGAGR